MQMSASLCAKLHDVLDDDKKDVEYITIRGAYPPYLLLPSEGHATPPSQLLSVFSQYPPPLCRIALLAPLARICLASTPCP